MSISPDNPMNCVPLKEHSFLLGDQCRLLLEILVKVCSDRVKKILVVRVMISCQLYSTQRVS